MSDDLAAPAPATPCCAMFDAASASKCVLCAKAICAQDSYCCNNKWDSVCVGEVKSICGATCGGGGSSSSSSSGGGGGSCAHPICAQGVKLTPSCDPCATAICAQDSYCCNTKWDNVCVSEVSSICGKSCP